MGTEEESIKTKQSKEIIPVSRSTNSADIIIALINGIFNMKLSNAGVMIILWIIIRDIICFLRLPDDFDYSKWMFNTMETLNLFFSQTHVAVAVLSVIIVILLVIIVFLMFRIRHKQDEIDRISAVRNEALFYKDKGLMQSLREIAADEDGGNKYAK